MRRCATGSSGRLYHAKEVIVFGDLCDTWRPGDEIDLTAIYTKSYDGFLDIAGLRVFSTVLVTNNIFKLKPPKRQSRIYIHHGNGIEPNFHDKRRRTRKGCSNIKLLKEDRSITVLRILTWHINSKGHKFRIRLSNGELVWIEHFDLLKLSGGGTALKKYIEEDSNDSIDLQRAIPDIMIYLEREYASGSGQHLCFMCGKGSVEVADGAGA